LKHEGGHEDVQYENPEAQETLGPDLTFSFRSQSHTEESVAGKELFKYDGKR